MLFRTSLYPLHSSTSSIVSLGYTPISRIAGPKVRAFVKTLDANSVTSLLSSSPDVPASDPSTCRCQRSRPWGQFCPHHPCSKVDSNFSLPGNWEKPLRYPVLNLDGPALSHHNLSQVSDYPTVPKAGPALGWPHSLPLTATWEKLSW